MDRESVPGAMEGICEKGERSIQSLLHNKDADEYEAVAFRVAVWTQAEIIRIHPFSDGNGRTSRAVTDYILVRLRFNPVPIEACRQEYIDLLNAYYKENQGIDPLVHLYVRLATGG